MLRITAILLSLLLRQTSAQELEPVFDSINKCCSLGAEKAETSSQGCDDIQVPVKDVIAELQATCISTMEVCCSQARRDLQCEAGREAALAGEECAPPETLDQRGQETFKDCCLSCTLGIIVASMEQKCDGVANIFGCPLEQPFTHCCTEIAGPTNITEDLQDLEGSATSASPENPETQTETQTEEDKNDICPVGFQYNALIHVCDDVDECEESLHSCSEPDEVCYNTIGSYVCEVQETGSGDEECPPGYTFFLVTCIDINECTEETHDCPEDTVCVNTEGNYTCQEFDVEDTCPTGYQDQGGQCEDINECMTGQHDCLESQRCDNTPGSFVCVRFTTCGTGYTLNYVSGKCEDNDECALGTHNCDALGPGYLCRNIQGSFRCEKKRCNVGEILDEDGFCVQIKCSPGFEVGPLGNCLDIDECLSPVCSPGEDCINTMGSYRCVSACELGFRLEPRTGRCQDIDECAVGLAACFLGASCVNTLGSYKCSCGSGYQEVDGVCQDIDECTTNGRVNRFVCGIDSECQNFPGSYRCVCKQGFKPAGKSCVDVNECEEIPNICSHDCTNLWGSYRCHCREGYKLSTDSRSCVDIDECEETHRCMGQCYNEPGSYRCSCPNGYKISSNGLSCEDIDECQTQQPCQGRNSQCHNTRGSFKCLDMTCPAGYRLESSQSNRCKRTNTRCRSSDFTCLRKPVSISFNVISLISQLQVDRHGLDLFTMQSAKYEQITTKFTLTVVNIHSQPGVRPVSKSSFRLKTGLHQATLALVESVKGPQEIELELLMEMYYLARYTGSALAKLYIYVTPYEF